MSIHPIKTVKFTSLVKKISLNDYLKQRKSCFVENVCCEITLLHTYNVTLEELSVRECGLKSSLC